jgi:hypothetical protein
MPRKLQAASAQQPSVTTTVTMPPPAPPAEISSADERPDFWEYLQALTPEQWKEHIVYLTRDNPKTSINGIGGYLAKLTQPFDVDDIKTAYGGYEFSYILKEGRDICKRCRNASGHFRIEAPPKFDSQREIAGVAPANGHAAGTENLLQQFVGVLRDELARSRESNNGSSPATDKAIEMLSSASEKAMEIVRAQVPSAKSGSSDMREMLGLMRDMGLVGAPQHSKTLIEQILELIQMPVIGPQILELFKPKNPLDELMKFKGLKELLDGLGGDGGGRGDWKTALVDRGIPAVQDLVGALADNRKAAIETAREARMRAEANARAAQSVQTIEAQRAQRPQPANARTTVATAPAGQAAAPPTPAGAAGPFRVVPINGDGAAAAPDVAMPVPETTASADEFLKGVKIRFVELLAAGEDTGFIVDFLDAARPDFVEMLLKYSPAQITNFFSMDPIVKHAVENPRWSQFLQEARAYLEEANTELEPENTLKN